MWDSVLLVIFVLNIVRRYVYRYRLRLPTGQGPVRAGLCACAHPHHPNQPTPNHIGVAYSSSLTSGEAQRLHNTALGCPSRAPNPSGTNQRDTHCLACQRHCVLMNLPPAIITERWAPQGVWVEPTGIYVYDNVAAMEEDLLFITRARRGERTIHQ